MVERDHTGRRKINYLRATTFRLKTTVHPLELRAYIRVPASVARFPRRNDDGELRTVLSSATERSRMEQATMFGHRAFPFCPAYIRTLPTVHFFPSSPAPLVIGELLLEASTRLASSYFWTTDTDNRQALGSGE